MSVGCWVLGPSGLGGVGWLMLGHTPHATSNMPHPARGKGLASLSHQKSIIKRQATLEAPPGGYFSPMPTETTLVLIKPGGVQRNLIGEITKRIDALAASVATLQGSVDKLEAADKARSKPAVAPAAGK